MARGFLTHIAKAAIGLIFILGFVAQSFGQSLSTTGQGVVGGGVLGAGTGAIVGAAVHHPVKGALIGGGIGALTGGVVGHALQTRDESQARLERQVSEQQREIEHQRREIEELRQSQETE